MWESNCCNVKVMIVSPSDVPKKQREIVKNALYHWNEINFKNIVFSVLGYDINAHADSGSHPQESLNHQLLEQADLIIAIFWTKLGTPTREYPSGSEEEIERHINAGKKALLFFSNERIDPQLLIDPKRREQYEQLMKYKESKKNTALYEDFSTDEEFQKKLNDNINLIANIIERGKPFTQTIEYGMVHIKVKGTPDDCEQGTATVTYLGSSLVDADQRPIIYEDQVKAGGGKNILAQEFTPEAEILNYETFEKYKNNLIYKLTGPENKPLSFVGGIRVRRKLQQKEGFVGLHIPYNAKYMIVQIDVSEAQCIKEYIDKYNGIARLMNGKDKDNPIPYTFNKLSQTYTITIQDAPKGSDLVLAWKNDEV
ncbi:hypothetical protein II898_11480 [bacterium]|nr:hypothetical protein [bacterium]